MYPHPSQWLIIFDLLQYSIETGFCHCLVVSGLQQGPRLQLTNQGELPDGYTSPRARGPEPGSPLGTNSPP